MNLGRVAGAVTILLAALAPARAAGADEAEGPLGLTSLEMAFTEALALIALACLFVPLARRLGLGTVIGYLVSGVVAGAVLRLSYASHPEELLHFAEFGVVLFLFVIGLEFRPRRLWEMRGTILGRGLAQVLATGAVLGGTAWLGGLGWRAAMIVGLGLALSSTALVMREIDETGERRTAYGETAIAVLLFEDLAIVPLLLLVTLLAPGGGEMSLADDLAAAGTAIAAIAFLIAATAYVIDPLFRAVARTRTPELMTAAALGVVIFASFVMAVAGLSYAMGAFIAGVMLADSTFRHEVEADIEPFRGLFLGLFFMAVGLSLDLDAVAAQWPLIVIAVPLLIVLKGLAVYGVNRAFGAPHRLSARLAFAMAQHGEFGFVLFAAAGAAGLLDPATTSVAIAIVTLSMALSSQSDRLFRAVMGPSQRAVMEEDFKGADGPILIVGFGRVGQMVAQPLVAEGLDVTLLDHDADRVQEAGRFGRRVHFGDGRRREVLQAAGAATARVVVAATDDPETTLAIVRTIRRSFPGVRLVARAYDRIEALRLAEAGADEVVRETLASALEIGAVVLGAIGYPDEDVQEAIARTRQRDEERLAAQARVAAGRDTRAALIGAIVPEPLGRKAARDGAKPVADPSALNSAAHD